MWTFNPILKSIIWGGEKIAPFKGIQTDLSTIGEPGRYQEWKAPSQSLWTDLTKVCRSPSLLKNMVQD